MSVNIINARKEHTVSYSEIKAGQYFLWENNLYIKGDEKRNHDDDDNLAIDVASGYVITPDREQVTPVDVEIKYF